MRELLISSCLLITYLKGSLYKFQASFTLGTNVTVIWNQPGKKGFFSILFDWLIIPYSFIKWLLQLQATKQWKGHYKIHSNNIYGAFVNTISIRVASGASGSQPVVWEFVEGPKCLVIFSDGLNTSQLRLTNKTSWWKVTVPSHWQGKANKMLLRSINLKCLGLNLARTTDHWMFFNKTDTSPPLGKLSPLNSIIYLRLINRLLHPLIFHWPERLLV